MISQSGIVRTPNRNTSAEKKPDYVINAFRGDNSLTPRRLTPTQISPNNQKNVFPASQNYQKISQRSKPQNIEKVIEYKTEITNSGRKINVQVFKWIETTPKRSEVQNSQTQSHTPSKKHVPFTDPQSPFYKQYLEMSKPVQVSNVLQPKIPHQNQISAPLTSKDLTSKLQNSLKINSNVRQPSQNYYSLSKSSENGTYLPYSQTYKFAQNN